MVLVDSLCSRRLFWLPQSIRSTRLLPFLYLFRRDHHLDRYGCFLKAASRCYRTAICGPQIIAPSRTEGKRSLAQKGDGIQFVSPGSGTQSQFTGGTT